MRITRTLANIVVSVLEKVSLSLDVMSTYPFIQVAVLTGGDTTYLSLLFLKSVSTVREIICSNSPSKICFAHAVDKSLPAVGVRLEGTNPS